MKQKKAAGKVSQTKRSEMWSMRRNQSAKSGFKAGGRGWHTKECDCPQMTEVGMGTSILQLHAAEFCEEPEWVWKWILPRASQ